MPTKGSTEPGSALMGVFEVGVDVGAAVVGARVGVVVGSTVGRVVGARVGVVVGSTAGRVVVARTGLDWVGTTLDAQALANKRNSNESIENR